VVRRFSEVVEYQVQLTSPGGLVEMAIEIEPEPSCAEPAILARRIQDDLQLAFSLRIPVTFVPPGTLPRYELKARRWIKLQR
jgi:phenylacetate-CoA ligase